MADAAYDRYGEAYQRWMAPIVGPSAIGLLDPLADGLHTNDTLDVVDVGVGTGTLALAALERWPQAVVTGIDPSRVMLGLAAGEARSRGTGVAERLSLIQGDASDLPMPTAAVDIALSSFVIHLVPNRAAALREILRVLRPGGNAAVLTWQSDDEPFEPEDLVQLALDELGIDVPEHGGGDPRPYTSPSSAAAELRRIGFRDVRAARVWLEHQFTAQSYLDVVEHWTDDDIFARLDASVRTELRSRLLRKLERLEPAALLWRRPLVRVIARRP